MDPYWYRYFLPPRWWVVRERVCWQWRCFLRGSSCRWRWRRRAVNMIDLDARLDSIWTLPRVVLRNYYSYNKLYWKNPSQTKFTWNTLKKHNLSISADEAGGVEGSWLRPFFPEALPQAISLMGMLDGGYFQLSLDIVGLQQVLLFPAKLSLQLLHLDFQLVDLYNLWLTLA